MVTKMGHMIGEQQVKSIKEEMIRRNRPLLQLN